MIKDSLGVTANRYLSSPPSSCLNRCSYKLLLLALFVPLASSRDTSSVVFHFDEYEHSSDRPVHCRVGNEIVSVQWDAEASNYVPAEDKDSSNNKQRSLLEKRGYRHNFLRSQNRHVNKDLEADLFVEKDLQFLSHGIRIGYAATDEVSRRLAQQQIDEQLPLRDFKVCTCENSEPLYCPLQTDACGFFDEASTSIDCYRAETQMEKITKNALLLGVLWFGFILGCLCCSQCGRSVVHYVISLCHHNHPENLADYLLANNRGRARLLLRRGASHTRWFRGIGGDAEASKDDGTLPSLSLKTRIFHAEPESPDKDDSNNDNKDDELDQQCIICFADLEEGERVGDLCCGHTFHADCLKIWLKRRNACPLCNAENVAATKWRSRAQTHSTLFASSDDDEASAERSSSSRSSYRTNNDLTSAGTADDALASTSSATSEESSDNNVGTAEQSTVEEATNTAEQTQSNTQA